MMVFENSDLKPYLLPFAEVIMRAFLANGINDLGYFSSVDKSPEELAENIKWAEMYGNDGEVDTKRLHIAYKIRVITTVLKRITGAGPDIEQSHWEFFAFVLLKYILLGYLFYTDRAIEPNLRKRRGSINSAAYEYLHTQLRGRIGAYGCGADDSAIQKVIIPFSKLLTFITRGSFTIVPFAPAAPQPTRWGLPVMPNSWGEAFGIDRTEGYYMIVKDKASPRFGHVVAIYKCGDHWSLFDNNATIITFDKAQSDLISARGINGVNYTLRPGEIHYDVTFGDDSTFSTSVAHEDGRTYESNYIFSPGASYKLVRLAAAGGRRRRSTRKQRRRKNKSRKH